jgi:hypothetical protein
MNIRSFNMFYISKRIFFIGLLTITCQTMAANKLIQVIDKGQDGNTQYYTAACPNGSNHSIAVYFAEANDEEVSQKALELEGPSGIGKKPNSKVTKICASVGSENEKCNSSWDVQAAAKASCK